jgi:hypothetical protein
MMRRIRLMIVSVLFIGWLGYLGYLVATRPQTEEGRPLVLSRPQILTSDVDVIAELPAPPGRDMVKVTVLQVLYPEDCQLQPGDTILVSTLEQCAPLRRSAKDHPPADWSGEGPYLLPLKRLPGKENRYEVAPIPPSPGFEPGVFVYRIYPATQEVLAQYRRIDKE